MTVRRVMGTETEYGVAAPGRYNPVQLSFDVVEAASTPQTRHIRWDYRQENPVCDARGFTLERAAAPASMLTDTPQAALVNVIAPNGGRIYVDHAHPEYSSPETSGPMDALLYDRAGDALMQQAAQRAGGIALYKNNVDGKGASWGSHENYMASRKVPFAVVSTLMATHFATRLIYTGSGRVGLGERSERGGYQLSQRADYLQAVEGLQTTFDRPLVNTRDEPHAPDSMRRLHVIAGDANRMDVPAFLKLGTTSMLLWLLEWHEGQGVDPLAVASQWRLADPVEAVHAVSRDLSLAAPLKLASGEETTAWNLQLAMFSAVYEAAAQAYDTGIDGEPRWPDRDTRNVMAMWRQALMDTAALRHADDDKRLGMDAEGSRVEWLLKWQLLERTRRRSAPDMPMDEFMAGAKAAAFDLQWAALDPRRSVFAKVQASTERLVTDGEVRQAMQCPPADTRAWTRAEAVRRFAPEIKAASWTHLAADAGDGRLCELAMDDPLAYGQQAAAETLDAAADAAEALRLLGRAGGDGACCA